MEKAYGTQLSKTERTVQVAQRDLRVEGVSMVADCNFLKKYLDSPQRAK